MATLSNQINRIQGTLEDARQRALEVVAETSREMMPVRIFTQGQREMLSGVMPVRVLIRNLAHNAAKKGGTAETALDATNRPVIDDHWKGFARYLIRSIEKGENYIIPPLTLNSTGETQIFVPANESKVDTGYMVLPDETTIYITDGQHRFLGIQQVADELRGTAESSNFMNMGVPVMITIESDTAQVHQDFADAGKTKALPPSLLAVYDTRQPANHVVMEITRQLPLLNGRVDATSTQVSKSSQFLFLANQVRQFVKHSLTGVTGANDVQFAEQADAALSNNSSMKRWTTTRLAFLRVMTEIVPDWKEIGSLPAPGGPDSANVVQKTKEVKLRQRVPVSGAFLNAVGLVSFEVLKEACAIDRDEEAWVTDLREKLEPLHSINWERSAEIWNGNIVVGGDKLRTQAPAVKGAAKAMLKVLGIYE